MKRVWLSGVMVLVMMCSADHISGGWDGKKSFHGKDTEAERMWKEIESLKQNQKFQQAHDVALKILERTQSSGDTENWTRALITVANFKIGLHSYEDSIRFFLTTSWPQDALSQCILKLYAARNLVVYYDSYQWEIAQREQIISEQEIDLRQWTAGQIMDKVSALYESAWSQREKVGDVTVTSFPDLIQRKTYPAGLRATLRDFITYEWASFLGGSHSWQPKESAELYKVDFQSLLAGSGSQEKTSEESADHPLEKSLALLDDLYRWHNSHHDRGNMLETQLERLRILRNHFTENSHKESIGIALEKLIQVYSNEPWSAAARYELGNLLVEQGEPFKAHLIAREGYQSYPDSQGGKLCQALISQIESPSFQLEMMRIDGAGQRSIRVQHRNMKRLYLRAYSLDFDSFLRDNWKNNMDFNWMEWPRIVHERKPTLDWAVDLEDPGDYGDHVSYITPPIKTNGLYMIAASVKDDFPKKDNRIDVACFLVSDITLTTSIIQDPLEVQVFDGPTGKPVPGATVQIVPVVWDRKELQMQTILTDSQGRIHYAPKEKTNSFIIIAKWKDSIACLSTYTTQTPEAQERSQDLIYTDRSYYRPGQTLYYKTVSLKGKDADFFIQKNKSVTIRLYDPNGKEIASQTAQTNAFGSSAGKFTIPAGRLLGAYRLATDRGNTVIRVEEYKRPTFEVQLKQPETDILLNQSVTVTGSVTYYFGMPVTKGEVVWRIRRKPKLPYWYFWWFNAPISQEYEIAAGNTQIQSDGTFSIAFLPESDPKADPESGISYVFEISAEVTDEGGETRAHTLPLNIGYCAIEALVSSDSMVFDPEKPAQFKIIRQSLNGDPRAGTGEYEIFELSPPPTILHPSELPVKPPSDKPVTSGDLQRPRWEPEPGLEKRLFEWSDGPKAAYGKLIHTDDGISMIREQLKPGPYRIRYKTQDDRGATFKTQMDFLVMSSGDNIQVPIFALADTPSAMVGNTISVLYGSGYAKQDLYIELAQDSRIIRSDHIVSDSKAHRFDIPIDESLRGGFVVSVYFLRDYILYRTDIGIMVPWDNKKLQIEFATFRDLLKPGQTETWQVKVHGPNSEIVAAEILAYMFDRALDLFGPHTYPMIDQLYPSRQMGYSRKTPEGSVYLQSILNDVWYTVAGAEGYYPDQLIALDGYGIGGLGRRHYMFKNEGMMMGAMLHDGVGLDESKSELVERPESFDAPAAAPPAPQEQTKVKALSSTSSESQSEDETKPALRTDFSETAFFLPQLTCDDHGEATIQFKVPDSVTSWRVFVHAITMDLKSAVIERNLETRKQLMVRPYLPRYFREGDRAGLKVMVNNAGNQTMSGDVTLKILNPETDEDITGMFRPDMVSQPWTVSPQNTTTVTFSLTIPAHIGLYAFEIKATTDELSDGERRPIPVLPGRMHLTQSRFMTLKDAQRRSMSIPDLKAASEDSSLIHESLNVSVEGQLMYHVISALPYLIYYPYECVEQTLNRFVSTSILSTLYDRYPVIANAAKRFSERDTPLEKWNLEDPNRKMALTETPWMIESEGGTSNQALINVLDPKIADAHRENALIKLSKYQNPTGAFPWWPGGPDNPYMTLYTVYGFAKAIEFGDSIPKEMILRATRYLGDHYRGYYRERLKAESFDVEFLTFLNYVLSCFPDQSYYQKGFSESERKEILEYTFTHWRNISPYCKAYLALTLQRSERNTDARIILDSIMDSAKTAPDQGIFWIPEDRGWLWYNDNIESHAMILRAVMEIQPEDPRLDDIALWLFLNKKMNIWKSTRTTAEVIYSLTRYLNERESLGIREEANISLGSMVQSCIIDPNDFENRSCNIHITGAEIDAEKMFLVTVEKQTKGFMFASMNWHYSTEKLPEEARGDFLDVKRRFFIRENKNGEMVLKPIAEGERIHIGDQLEVHLSIQAKHPMEFVHLYDPRGAGFEPENKISGYRWDLGINWYEEIKDSSTNFFFEWLPQGEYTFKYRIRASMAGYFKVAPATLQSMYSPEFSAFSSGKYLEID